ncbi:M4 family metallopeptidase [Undibacterium arcticum]
MSQRGNHGLVADHGFVVASEHPGVVGTKIHRVNHTFKNVRVWSSESVVVTNDAGSIVSESISERRQGLGLGLGQSFAGKAGTDIDVNPRISGKQATDLVVSKLAPTGTHIVPPKAELIIYPVMKTVRVASAVNKAEAALNAMDLEEVVDHYELAYFVQTRMTSNGRPNLNDSIVSATDGHLIKQWSAMHTVVGVGHSEYNGDVPINTTLSGGTYQMIDASRGTGGTYGAMAITNANHTTSAGSVYTNSTNTWGDGQNYISGGSTTNANGQTAAVNAMWGLMNTYDMLTNTLGWQSLDGVNTATYIAAHVNSNYDNAYYSDTCKCMYIGDGSSFTSLGSIDVIGHEMSHGVTASTSNLTYSGESGGLNESNSDIGGEMVEAYARNGGTGTTIPGGNDWMMGVEISKTGTPLRWMYKPSKDGSSPNAWSSTVGNLDVHYSSGPNNRMYYFLSQGSNATSSSDYYSAYLTKSPAAMTGIGNDKAYRIWFKASTTKFTASTNYADARSKVLAAAQELYGVGSKEAIAVQRAYAAINVGTDIDETGGAPGPVTISSPANVTVAAGSAASFSVSASSGTAPYSYKWYRNGVLISGASSATYSFTAQSTDNGAVFKVTVTDSATTPTTATSGNATLTVTTGGTATETMVNGGFESGTSPWTGNTGDIGTWSGEPAATGTKDAWMGGNGSAITETLSQTVSIPSTATSATLTFALHIDTAESGSTAYDKLTVKVKNTAGTVLQTLATYTNVNAASGYQTRTFDLSAYKGQTVQVSFSETEDSSLQTSFVLDNVSLMVK